MHAVCANQAIYYHAGPENPCIIRHSSCSCNSIYPGKVSKVAHVEAHVPILKA